MVIPIVIGMVDTPFGFNLIIFKCPDGEIGRHASLRGWCSQGCASSSLVLGT